MVILLESPWPILFIGIVVEAVLAVGLMQTGRGKYLVAMIGVAVVVVIGLVVERLVVTDREAVERTLDAAVVAVRKNDIDGVLNCILPSAKEPREESRWLLSLVDVEEGHISDLEIKINRLTSPPTAEAKFLAVGKGRDRKGEFPYQGFAQRVVVQLQLQGDRWLVTGYKLLDFQPSQL
jgi:hypothetical protein